MDLSEKVAEIWKKVVEIWKKWPESRKIAGF